MLHTLFISHGSPMHAIQPGRAGEVWAATARELSQPKALLVITAHWETAVPTLSAHTTPSMIYDFGGFPEALYNIRYPAKGAPDVAIRAARLIAEAGLHAEIDSVRGLDHGTWVPLLHMFPDADIPVVQLSVQPSLGAAHALKLGRALAHLREEGVLVIGSGHLTHNLRDWLTAMQTRQTEVIPYVTEFQQWAEGVLARADADALVHYRERAPDARRAHPTEEHFLPLIVAFGAGLGADGMLPEAHRIFDGVEGNALAMDAYRFS
jgi:4,5-DOPA dioxygenase extradiol